MVKKSPPPPPPPHPFQKFLDPPLSCRPQPPATVAQHWFMKCTIKSKEKNNNLYKLEYARDRGYVRYFVTKRNTLHPTYPSKF